MRFGIKFHQAAAQTGWSFDWTPSLGVRFEPLGLVDVRIELFREYVSGSDVGFGGVISTSPKLLHDRLSEADATYEEVATTREPDKRFLTMANGIVCKRRAEI